LNESEAEEVVQETVINVAKNIGKLKYDPARGSFKGWLLTITRWRIADQFRKRRPSWDETKPATGASTARTAAIDRLPQTASLSLEHAWEQEWRASLFQSALTAVKQRTEPRHYQVFDCYELQQWPAQKVAKELRVSLAQVYLIRHRVLAALKAEVKRLERGNV
jgi:RNA polymerase sigma factor (sigma-70 family)